MRRALVPISLAWLVVGTGVGAEEHLVSPEAASARLVEAGAARERGLATLDFVLSSAPAAAAVPGADLSRARAALVSLSDQELRDLASRAEAFGCDPVAGLSGDVDSLLVVLLIVLIVLLVLKAV